MRKCVQKVRREVVIRNVTCVNNLPQFHDKLIPIVMKLFTSECILWTEVCMYMCVFASIMTFFCPDIHNSPIARPSQSPSLFLKYMYKQKLHMHALLVKHDYMEDSQQFLSRKLTWSWWGTVPFPQLPVFQWWSPDDPDCHPHYQQSWSEPQNSLYSIYTHIQW